VFAVASVISIVTMPLTAMWFLLIGIVLNGAAGILLAFGSRRPAAITILSVGAGVLVGPVIYLGLAVVTA